MNLPGGGMPSPEYLAAIGAQPGPAASFPPAPPAAPPPPGAPDYGALIGSTLGGTPPPAAPIMLGGKPINVAPPLEAGPPPAPMGPPPPPASAQPVPGPAPGPDAIPERPQPYLHQVYGGGAVNVPAKETELRGPTLKAAQVDRNAAFAGAAQAVTERAQETAAGDFAIALEQERKAGIREDAANYTANERAQEMEQRQADFDQSVKAMGEAGTVDPSRFFSSAGTGQKIAMMVSLLVGGLAEAKGAKNTGAEAIKAVAANDVKAQEFAYNATRDQANAKQTAFSMAMQKYNNVDAARAAARAASMDVLTAQLAKQAALWKGTEAENRATIAIADLQNDRMNQIQQGVAFAPGRQVAVGPSWVDADGIHYNEQQVRDLKKEERGQEHDIRKIGAQTAGDVIKEGAKVDKTAAKEERALSVQLPNGDVVKARDSTQAKELADASASIHETNRLVAEAKKIREGEGFRVYGSPARARLEQIQKNLITGYAVQHNLGAISGPDMELATGGTAKLFDVGPGPEAALDGLSETAQANLRNKVKTLPDAPGTAKGAMPSSFTPHGAK
ncbi:MAG: hypothetical protein V4537_12420 [Pseudomonadota bacterium]